MKQSKYPLVAGDDPFVYVFFSEGPRGRIKKGVFFTKIGNNFFNLGFGDWHEETSEEEKATTIGDKF